MVNNRGTKLILLIICISFISCSTGEYKWKNTGLSSITRVVAGNSIGGVVLPGKIVGFDTATGIEKWVSELSEETGQPILLSDSCVFCVEGDRSNSTRVVCRDLFSGKTNWSRNLLAGHISKLYYNNKKVYVSSYDTLLVLDEKTGRPDWMTNTKTTPIGFMIKDSLLFMSINSEQLLTIINLNTQKILKKGIYPGKPTLHISNPIVYRNIVCIGTGNVYIGYDYLKDSVVWTSAGNGNIAQEPKLTDNGQLLFYQANEYRLIDLETGKISWKISYNAGNPAIGNIDNGKAALVDGKDLKILDLFEKRIVRQIHLPYTITCAPSIAKNIIYVGCETGLYAFTL